MSEYPTREFPAIRDGCYDWRYLAGVILAVLFVQTWAVGIVLLVWEVK